MIARSIAAIGGGIAITFFVLATIFMQPESTPADQSEETRAIVPLDRIVSGGPPRDGIPSIDNPKFVSITETGLQDSELVLGLEIEGDVRAYPLRILVWHEIVND